MFNDSWLRDYVTQSILSTKRKTGAWQARTSHTHTHAHIHIHSLNCVLTRNYQINDCNCLLSAMKLSIWKMNLNFFCSIPLSRVHFPSWHVKFMRFQIAPLRRAFTVHCADCRWHWSNNNNNNKSVCKLKLKLRLTITIYIVSLFFT